MITDRVTEMNKLVEQATNDMGNAKKIGETFTRELADCVGAAHRLNELIKEQ